MSGQEHSDSSVVPSASVREYIRKAAADLAAARPIPREQFPGHKEIYCTNLEGVLGGHTLRLLDALESVEAERETLSREVERLRKINSELVRDHNVLVGARARETATPGRAYDALTLAMADLQQAQRTFDNALGIVRKEMPGD